MKNALKEYWFEVWLPSCKWIGRHWKGYTLFILMIFFVDFLYVAWWTRDLERATEKAKKGLENLRNKFTKKEIEPET